MNKMNLRKLKVAAFVATMFIAFSCDNEDGIEGGSPDPDKTAYYFAAIESGSDPATEVIANADSFSEGEISPVDNGIQQPTWMAYYNNGNRIISAGYTTAPQFTSYEIINGELAEVEKVFVDLGVYASEAIDDDSMLFMGAPRSGTAAKKIYEINTVDMSISRTVEVDFGNDASTNSISFPVDMKLKGDKLFVAYYMVKDDGSFATPDANQARIAVLNYPALTLDKIISDDRTANLGRYYSFNVLEEDEKGDIYTFSPSSLACGYAPVPANNSGILRIKSGESEFDSNYHIDFETLSGGYKINDLFYVGNGKAVVKVLKEDETNPAYLWGTYSPNSATPLIEIGVVDLYNESFEIISSVPKSGGGWNSASFIEDGKLHIGMSSSTYASIYIIDPETATAVKGSEIDGNYVKSLLYLESAEE